MRTDSSNYQKTWVCYNENQGKCTLILHGLIRKI